MNAIPLGCRVFLLAVGAVAFFSEPARSNPARPVEYVFIPDTSRWLEIALPTMSLFGKVDAEGNYRVERTYGHNAISCHASVVVNGPKPYPAYEFRSGWLVPGKMMTNGDFVPEVGSKRVRFEDYKYGPGAIRIWNLPGFFTSRYQIEDSISWLNEQMDKDPVYFGNMKSIFESALERLNERRKNR